MRSTTYSIIAATAYGNRGAQAMLETVIGRLRQDRPDSKFHVFSYYPRDDRELVTAPHVDLHSSTPVALALWLLPWSLFFGLLRLVLGRRVLRLGPAAIRAIGESEALLDIAGVSFIDGREKFLPFNLLTLLPAWLLGTPIIKLPQAVGPFRGRLNRIAAAWMLPRCSMIWARGAQTASYLEASGFRNIRFDQADDIAFNHRDSYAITRESGARLASFLSELERARQGLKGVIGLCPSSVVAVQAAKEGGDYEPVMAALIRELSRSGFLVVLFPNATRGKDDVAQRNNDLPLIRRLARAAGELSPSPLMLDFDVNAAGIKRVIAATDVVLVSRFHAMVGALALQVPAAVLGWSHKYAEVMARFGLEENVMDYRNLEGSELTARVMHVFGARENIREMIRAALPMVQASAERPLLSVLSASPRGGSA